MPLRVAELETLFTANIDQYVAQARRVEKANRDLAAGRTQVQITADADAAERAIAAVEAAADGLSSLDAEVQVGADTGVAVRNMAAVETSFRSLNGQQAEIQVTADTSAAESAIADVEAEAAAAGRAGGGDLAEGVADGVGRKADLISTAIKTALAFTWVGAGIAGGKALIAGMRQEVRADRVMAQTGLDEDTVAKIASAAGNAYADNFGDSIAENLDTARAAVQGGLIDPKATEQQMQDVIASVSGVADVLDEDVNGVLRSTKQLMQTGLADGAQEAFDVIVAGQQAGLNVSEDWLDTINEYATQWRNLGLDAPQALGLVQQAVQAGARDTDVAADALKEFSIRARDIEDKGAREAFKDLGFSASEMQRRVAGGGGSAVEALGQTLDALRKIEDPAKRNATAVKLFGTQAEDLGDALYAMDLDTAGKQFDDLSGRAERALTALGDSPAARAEEAKRSIELSAAGIQGALAEAFADPLADGADWITTHQGDITSAVSTIGDMTFQMVETGLYGFASMTDVIGGFIAGPVADLVEGLGSAALAFDAITPGDQNGAALSVWAAGAADGMRDLGEGAQDSADRIRDDVLPTIGDMRDRWNDATADMVANATVNDTTAALAQSIAEVGTAADGTAADIDVLKGKVDTSTEAGKRFDEQARSVVDALGAQIDAARRNGESQDELKNRVRNARQAFIDQADAMGIPRKAAKKLADEYGLIPKSVTTTFATPGLSDAQTRASALDRTLNTIDGKQVTATVAIRQYGQAAMAEGGAPEVVARAMGPITGGTPGKDSVPAILMPGEHVLTVSDVQKMGGQGAVYAFRSALQAGLVRAQAFAAGGAVEGAQKALSRARQRRSETRSQLRSARDSGDGARVARLERDLDRRERQVERLEERLSRLRDLSRQTQADVRRGNVVAAVSDGPDAAFGVVDRLFEESRNSDLSKKRRKSLARTARESERALARLYRQAERVEDRLAGARDRAAELGQIAEGVASRLSGEAHLGDALVPRQRTNATGEVDYEPTTARGVVGSVQATANRLRAFGKKLARLRKAGLRGRALAEIEGLGSEQGSEVADAFLADRSQIDDLNAAYNAVDTASAAAGQTVTEGFAKGGARAADAFVDELEARQKDIDNQLARWGKTLGNELLKSIGLKVGKGGKITARAAGGPLTAGDLTLVGERGPELIVPSAAGYVLNATRTRAALGGPSGGPMVARIDPDDMRVMAEMTAAATVAASRRTAAGVVAATGAAQDLGARYQR